MWNLVPLCDGHHVADHLGLLKITGRAPFDLTFDVSAVEAGAVAARARDDCR